MKCPWSLKKKDMFDRKIVWPRRRERKGVRRAFIGKLCCEGIRSVLKWSKGDQKVGSYIV